MFIGPFGGGRERIDGALIFWHFRPVDRDAHRLGHRFDGGTVANVSVGEIPSQGLARSRYKCAFCDRYHAPHVLLHAVVAHSLKIHLYARALLVPLHQA